MSDWEGGQRQGVRWRRIGAAVLVVAVIGGGIYGVRNRGQIAIETDGTPVGDVTETVDVVVTAPLRAGDRWYCPSTHPITAYDGGEYFPAHYPDRNEAEQPADCFADPQRADDAGYDLADPPEGAILAGGVYLEPTRAPTTAACGEVANYVGFTVPCPGRLPTPAFGPTCAQDSCVFSPESREGVVIEHRTFAIPPDWPGSGNPQLFVTAVEIAREVARGQLMVHGEPALVACSADDPVEATSRPRFVVCPAGQTWVPRIQGEPHEDHTAAFWRRGEVVYAASVDGQGTAAEELLHALIDGIEYVDPS